VKRLLKLFISIGFFVAISVVDCIRLLLGKQRPAACVALYYHSVQSEERERFGRQMDALIRLATPIAATIRQPLLPGTHYAAITFDDGFVSVIENAVPELVKRRIPAALFVVTGLLGKKPNWATFGEGYSKEERIADLDQLKALPTDLITIGSHTISHPLLTSLPEADAQTELSTSRETLKSLLDREITLFSFPYGASSERIVSLCRAAGYDRIFTILPSLAFANPHEFVTGRVAVAPADWPIEFRLKLLGAYRWLPKVFEWKAKFFSRPGCQALQNSGLANGPSIKWH
jgi:peptidoglycan/xylan/chitin deacetylase (PgdA/CDA1 family)